MNERDRPIPEDMLRSLEGIPRGNTPAITLVSQLLYAKTDLAVHMEPNGLRQAPG